MQMKIALEYSSVLSGSILEEIGMVFLRIVGFFRDEGSDECIMLCTTFLNGDFSFGQI